MEWVLGQTEFGTSSPTRTILLLVGLAASRAKRIDSGACGSRLLLQPRIHESVQRVKDKVRHKLMPYETRLSTSAACREGNLNAYLASTLNAAH